LTLLIREAIWSSKGLQSEKKRMKMEEKETNENGGNGNGAASI